MVVAPILYIFQLNGRLLLGKRLPPLVVILLWHFVVVFVTTIPAMFGFLAPCLRTS